jgi:hypothetical protein
VDFAMAILVSSELEPDELADFVATVAKAAGVGVRAVMARIELNRSGGNRVNDNCSL